MAYLCVKHGGNSPGQKKAAKERLLELVDPALSALHKVLTDPKTDDHNKVRAAQVVLDRAGFKPGMVVEVKTTQWDTMAEQVYSEGGTDVSGLAALTPPGVGQPDPIGYEDVEQIVQSAQDDADRERHDAETAEYVTGRIYPDENTVRGEVVDEAPPSYGLDPRTRG